MHPKQSLSPQLQSWAPFLLPRRSTRQHSRMMIRQPFHSITCSLTGWATRPRSLPAGMVGIIYGHIYVISLLRLTVTLIHHSSPDRNVSGIKGSQMSYPLMSVDRRSQSESHGSHSSESLKGTPSTLHPSISHNLSARQFHVKAYPCLSMSRTPGYIINNLS